MIRSLLWIVMFLSRLNRKNSLYYYIAERRLCNTPIKKGLLHEVFRFMQQTHSQFHKFAQTREVDVGLRLGMPREIALMLVRRRLK